MRNQFIFVICEFMCYHDHHHWSSWLSWFIYVFIRPDFKATQPILKKNSKILRMTTGFHSSQVILFSFLFTHKMTYLYKLGHIWMHLLWIGSIHGSLVYRHMHDDISTLWSPKWHSLKSIWSLSYVFSTFKWLVPTHFIHLLAIHIYLKIGSFTDHLQIIYLMHSIIEISKIIIG